MFTPEKVKAVDDNDLNEKEENMAYIYIYQHLGSLVQWKENTDYNDAIYT